MATYGDLKTRIKSELDREDMDAGEDSINDLTTHILAAVRYYQNRRFWFLLKPAKSVNTVDAQNYVTRPTDMHTIDRVSIPTLGYELERCDIADLEALDEPSGTEGQPVYWAEGEGGTQIRLYPTPNAVWALKMSGTALITALSADADTNVWTNDGQDLIAARACRTICKDVFKDFEAAEGFALAEAEALAALEFTDINRFDMPLAANW